MNVADLEVPSWHPRQLAKVEFWAADTSEGVLRAEGSVARRRHGYGQRMRSINRSDHALPPVTVGDLEGHLGGLLIGPEAVRQRLVSGLCDDSRALRAGDAYVAIPGRTWHGLEFEDHAATAGAVVAISDRPGRRLPTIVVTDPRAVIGPLAAWFYGTPSARLHVFGVTGTNGKTSTAHFLYAGLAATGGTAGLISGSRIHGPGVDEVPELTTPEAISLQRTLAHFLAEEVTACAVEVSSHAVDERRVDGTGYRVMAFTNLTRDHLDYHGSMEHYFEAKAALFQAEHTELAAINIDDPYGRRLAASASATTWTCSTNDPSADVYVHDIRLGVEGTHFDADTPRGRIPVRLRTLGPHQVANAMVALTALAADDRDLVAAAAAMSEVVAIPGRCERIDAGQDFTAIVDYMHNTAAQHTLLPFLQTLTPGRLILVIGATGGRDRGKRRPLGRTAATYADVVIVTDESPLDEKPETIRSQVLSGARQVEGTEIFEVPNRRAAFDLAVTLASPGDTVVVAGRGADPHQRYGTTVLHFDDRDELHHAITGGAHSSPPGTPLPERLV